MATAKPTASKTGPAPEPAAEIPVVEPTPDELQMAGDSNWEFLDRVPTVQEVRALLETLPPVWGVLPVEFIDYVQALPSSKKTKREVEKDGRTFKVDVFVEVYTIYFSVAGRIQMLRTAQQINKWKVDFVPEPNPFPGNAPGFLEPMNGERLVYREYVEIEAPFNALGDLADGDPMPYFHLGRRPGTAWVPRKGGKQAAGSNPYEKVETSARGRALSAWGFGVLPGSGVASVEEMAGVNQNRAGIESETGEESQDDQETQSKTREGMISDILTICEDIAQRAGQGDGEKLKRIADYARNKFGVEMVTAADPKSGLPEDLDWTRVKDGQLQLLRGVVRKKLVEVKADAGQPDPDKPPAS